MIAKILLSMSFIIIISFLVLRIKNIFIETKLVVNEEVNLGDVDLNSKREFEISLVNLTRKDFEVAKIYTSCGCTKAIGAAPFIIKNGETVSIKFEFDPGSMHQKGDYIDHEAYFLTTRPVEKEYKVKITGRVI